MANNVDVLNLEGAQIGFRNFAGAEGPYNKAGDRNFVVFLDPEQAKDLEAKGWNIKWPKERPDVTPEDDDRNPYLPVQVAYNRFPPKVIMITDGNATRLEEEEVETLDFVEIEKSDIVLNPYHWSVNGKEGIKAYLKAIYVTVATDAFSSKYGV